MSAQGPCHRESPARALVDLLRHLLVVDSASQGGHHHPAAGALAPVLSLVLALSQSLILSQLSLVRSIYSVFALTSY